MGCSIFLIHATPMALGLNITKKDKDMRPTNAPLRLAKKNLRFEKEVIRLAF